MPAKDIYHDTVKNALIKEGWTITQDPLRLEWGSTLFYVDLGAEQLLAAEKGGKRIAVEIKSFIGPSNMADFEKALGNISCIETLWRRSNSIERYILRYMRRHLRQFSTMPSVNW